MVSFDYRQSHLGREKAASYHRQFSKNPYRAMMWRLERRELDSILDDRLSRAPRHLDFACGTGRLLSHLSQRARECVGIDVSEGMLDIARAEMPGCQLVCGDITGSDVLAGRTFDLITAFRFFPNAQSDLRTGAIVALARHLADDGILILNNHKNRGSLIYRLARLMRPHAVRQDMSDQEVRELVDAAGLIVIDTRHIGSIPSTEKYRLLPVPLLEWMERKLSRVALVRPFASNLIYVCVHAGKRSAQQPSPI